MADVGDTALLFSIREFLATPSASQDALSAETRAERAKLGLRRVDALPAISLDPAKDELRRRRRWQRIHAKLLDAIGGPSP